ncbi:hypothetical protein [Nocardia sp. NPDC051570]|uniref:hypothetical protein n=1 Tax=Nocardia sp. NPDC051570 TaxID=3364324 RepID=UPI0037B72D61
MPANHVPEPTPSDDQQPLSRRERRRKATQPQAGSGYPNANFPANGRAVAPARKYTNYRRG